MVATALVFANGDFNDGPAVRAALETPFPRLVIAVDGGLRHALASGLSPDLIVGDMDSVDPEIFHKPQIRHAEVLRYPAHKDETDLELALTIAVRRGWQTILIIGAVGDRLDQTLGNVFLLAHPALQNELHDIDVRLVSGRQTLWLAHPGQNVITGDPGDTVSLIPLSDRVTGIVTTAMEYPLRGETLTIGPARGISNVMQEKEALVNFESGLLLIIHTVGKA